MNKTKSTVITLAILALVALGIAVGFYMFMQKEIADIALKQQSIDKYSKKQLEASSLKNLISDIDKDLDKLSTRIIGKDETVSFIEYIESNARTAGAKISVDDVSYENISDEEKNFEYVVVTSTVEGSWEQVYRFISAVETIPYNIVLRKMQVASSLEGGGSWRGALIFSVLKIK